MFPWPGGFDHLVGLLDFGLDRPGSQGNQLGSLQVVHPIVVDPTAGTVDTLPSLEKEYEVIGGSMYAPLGGFVTTAMDYDGRLWFAHTERYEIFKRDLRGDTLLATRRADVELEPVTMSMQDSILALYAERPPGLPVPERSDFPHTLPVVKRMLTDGAGHLLVFIDAAGEEPGTHVDVFDASDGRFLGSVTLPVHLLTNPRPVATPGRLYGVITDDLGVPYVVRIDLEPGGGDDSTRGLNPRS
jgi:hypothetical protein